MNTPTTTTTKGKDYGERTVSELVSMVNTEYAAIMEAERTHLQRAIGIGEKLLDLKPRVAKHGEWQQWLKTNCPKISLETANLYMRLARPENLAKLEEAAAAKSVSVTDFTITEAREILANKSKSDATNNSEATEEEEKEEKDEDDDNDETEEEVVGKRWLETLAPDDLIFWLKEVRDTDYLRELAAKLAKELTPLPPKPDPLAIPPALQRAAPATQAPASSVSGVQRRY
jgi:hypothetical protein